MSCADRSQNPARPINWTHRCKRVAIPAWRLTLLAAAFLCIHHAHSQRQETASHTLDEARFLGLVRDYLPAAAQLAAATADEALSPVIDASGETIGWAAQTSPEALAITGYNGPSNLLVVLSADRHVLGTRLIESTDTAGHLAKIEANDRFFSQWNGQSATRLGAMGQPIVVSGATLTSEAIARGLAARFGGQDAHQWFPEELTLETIRQWFPDAVDFTESAPGEYEISGNDKPCVVLRASRMGIAVRGFQGPADVLIALEANTIRGVAMPGSRDNEPYTLDVRDELKFANPFLGVSATELIGESASPEFGVSGASETARSVDATVREMLRRHLAPPVSSAPDLKTGLALVWIAGGLLLGLTRLRGNRKARALFAILSIPVGGLFLGLMVGQDQWIAWARRGSFSGSSLALLCLSAAAVLVPTLTGKNIYCAHLCPHGAAQTIAGQVFRKRLALPPKLHRLFQTVPWLTLIALWVLAFIGSGFPISQAEPFEIWSVGFFAILPTAIFGIGLIAAFFLPQGYCHYGCPTGALLKFLTHAPGRWTHRDSLATGLVVIGAATAFLS